MEFEYKQFNVDLSQMSEMEDGEVKARVATLDVPDYENDVIVTGSVGRQEIVVSEWNHNCKQLFGKPPVGKGWVYEEADGLIAEMKFFMNLSDGEDAFKRVKNLDSVCRWSIAYKVRKHEWKKVQVNPDEQPELYRYLLKLKVDESSPVDDPGGVGTGTIGVKKGWPNLQVQRMLDMRYEIHKRRADMWAKGIS